MNLSDWSDRFIRWGFYLLFGLVPILLTPWNYELFEFNKMMAVYAITAVITGAWAIKSITKGKLEIARTPLDIPLLLFLSSQLLSALFSIDPHVSWFGYYSRFNGGMLSIVSYVLLFYALVSNWSNETNWPNLTKVINIALATGVVVALYAVAERLGIDRHLWVQDVQNRVFSTLGQPNWLAAYLTALSPLAWSFALNTQMSKLKIQNNVKAQNSKQFGNLNFGFHLSFEFWIWTFTAALFFIVLMFTRSRSGLFGFAVADIVFWGLVFAMSFPRKRESRNNKGWMPDQVGHDRNQVTLRFLLLHIAFALIVFFNGTHIDSIDRWFTFSGLKNRANNTKVVSVESTPSGTLLESGGTESGTIRKYVWQGAINAWRSSTKAYLIGTGTETFAFAFYQYRPKEHNLTSEWDFLYNKAHNEYLNYLATTGILGLGSYLLFIGVFTAWFFKCQMSNIKCQINPNAQSSKNSLDFGFDWKFDIWILQIALFAGWLSVLVTNFFGFSVVIVQVFLFLFPAMVLAKNQHMSFPIRLPRWSVSIVVLFTVMVVLLVGIAWYADTLYAAGYRMSRAGQYDSAVEKLSRAALFNPGEPLFADELGSAYAGLATIAIEEKDATRAGQFVRRSLSANDRAIATSPRNVNFWKTRTKIYYTFSSFDPAFNNAAIEALEQASRLSPRDPKITYNLSILYGRKGDNDKAIALLKTTIDLKPNYRDGYYALWVFYTEVRKPDVARQVLKDYLTNVDPGDKEFLSIVNE